MMLRRVVLVSILFGQLLTQETSIGERKPNMVVQILNKVLDDVIKELTTKNVTIPHVDLDRHGELKNVILSVPEMTKSTDGVGKFGFQMNLNLKEILVSGYYDVRDIDVPRLFPITGKGDFRINVDAVDVALKVKAINNYETEKFDFEISAFDISVNNSKLGFENLMEDPHVSDFLNELLGNLIPKLVRAFLQPLSGLLGIFLEHYGNGVINCIRKELDDLENCIKRLFESIVDDILRLDIKQFIH